MLKAASMLGGNYQMKTGKIKWYNEKKRFGFITTDEGQDVFLHASDIPDGCKFEKDDRVEFEVEDYHRGAKAVKVAKLVYGNR
jgi:cold shock protein